MHRSAVLLAALLGCGGPDVSAYLKLDLKLQTEEGLFFIPVGSHGGASLSGSLYVAGTVANTHPELAAVDVQIEVRLYRKKGDAEPERWYRYYAIDELGRIPPGGSVKIRQYIKQTASGYERCEVIVLKAAGRK